MTSLPNRFDRLSGAHRDIAWAVLRCIANGLWAAFMLMGLLWVVICVREERVALEALIPVVGALGLAGAFEVTTQQLVAQAD